MSENSKNGANNGQNESQENINTGKKKKFDKKQEFLKEFRDDLLGKDKESVSAFIDELISSKSINGSKNINKELKEFGSKIKLLDRFKDFDLDGLSIDDIKEKFSGEIKNVKLNRITLKNALQSDYNIEDKDYDKFVLGEVEKLTDDNFYDLKRSKNKRKDFITKIYSQKNEQIPSLKSKVGEDLIEKLKNELEEINKNTTEKRKKELGNLLEEIVQGMIHGNCDDDVTASITELLETNLFSLDFYRELLDRFYPNMSLRDAYKYKFITNLDRKIIIESELKKELGDKRFKEIKQDEQQIKNKGDNMGIEDLYFYRTNELIKRKEDVKKFIEAKGDEKGKEEGVLMSKVASNIASEINGEDEEIRGERIKNGPQTIDEIKKAFKKINYGAKIERFSGIENFKEGGIFEMISIIKNGGVNIEKKEYYKIVSVNETEKKLAVKFIGTDEGIELNKDVNNEVSDFDAFFNAFKEGTFKVNFYSETEFNNKLRDARDGFKNSELGTFNKEDLKNGEGKKLIFDKYIEGKKAELDRLKDEYNSLGDKDTSRKAELHEKIGKLKEEIDNYLKEDSNFEEKLKRFGVNDDTLLERTNYYILLSKLDELDGNGAKYGLGKDVYLETENGEGHLITGVDPTNGTITLSTLGGADYEASFEQFYTAFKKTKTKRVAKINDFNALLNVMRDDVKVGNKWKDFEFKSGKLEAKEENKSVKGKNVDYLVGKEGEVIYIDSINASEVYVQFGRVENVVSKKGQNKGEKTGEKITLSEELHKISLNDLKRFIEAGGFVPSLETGKDIKNVPEDLMNEMHRSFLGRLWQKGMSFETFIKGGKMLVDGIKDYLNKETDLKSAQWAGKLGGIMGALGFDEVADRIRIKTEGEQGEASEKELAELKKIDSGPATERIAKWLLNRNTRSYKIEAGLSFMLENYGVLNAKSLSKYNGKFLWYQAFGGRVGDKFFKEKEQECRELDIPFSEEYLMYWFVKAQCSDKGYNGIKRRSRLYKEAEAKWSNGIQGDFEKGQKDGKNKRNARDAVAGGVSDIMSGNIPGVLGWLDVGVGKGDNIAVMSKGFFCMLYSGVLYDTDQKVLGKLKDMWQDQGMPIVMTRFSTTKGDMETFNKTVLRLSERMEEIYGKGTKFEGMGAEARRLFDVASNRRGEVDLRKRVEAVADFWDKYGIALGRALHIVHTTKTEYAESDKLIKIEKDSDPVFKEYYDKLRIFTTLGQVFHKNYMDDNCGDEGVSGMNTNQIVKKWLKIEQKGFADDTMGRRMWKTISGDLNQVGKNRYSKDDEEDRERKKIYVIHELRDIVAGMIDSYGMNTEYFHRVMNRANEIGESFYEWGLDIFDFVGGRDQKGVGFSASGVLAGEADKLLEKIAMNIIRGKSGGESISFAERIAKMARNNVQDTADEVREKAKGVVDDEGFGKAA